MARIKKVELTETFVETRNAGALAGERGDCAVRALSIVTGETYERVREALRIAGRKDREGTWNVQMERALASLGFGIRVWSISERIAVVRSYPGVHSRLYGMTTHHPRRFPRAWERFREKRLLLMTSRHVSAYRDGIVHDYTVNQAKRIESIWEVTPMPADRLV